MNFLPDSLLYKKLLYLWFFNFYVSASRALSCEETERISISASSWAHQKYSKDRLKFSLSRGGMQTEAALGFLGPPSIRKAVGSGGCLLDRTPRDWILGMDSICNKTFDLGRKESSSCRTSVFLSIKWGRWILALAFYFYHWNPVKTQRNQF